MAARLPIECMYCQGRKRSGASAAAPCSAARPACHRCVPACPPQDMIAALHKAQPLDARSVPASPPGVRLVTTGATLADALAAEAQLRRKP